MMTAIVLLVMMPKYVALDFAFMLVFVSLVLMNCVQSQEHTSFGASETMTVMTQGNLVGPVVLPPSHTSLPRTLAGIVFVATLIVGLLALDLHYSKARTKART